MLKTDKERVIAELTEQLRTAESLIVADYRGLTNANLQSLRTELIKHGARFTVVKNTLTRRAAEASGTVELLALLEGPSAIAFVQADGDPAAVAKALSNAANETNILTIRGGILSGAAISEAQVESLAKLPPVDVVRGQLLAAIVAPVTALAGLLAAPLRDLVGLIDARIGQLEEGGETALVEESTPAAAAAADDEPNAETETVDPEPLDDAGEAVVAEDVVVAEAPVAESAKAESATADGSDAPVEAPEDEITESEKNEEE